MILLRSDSRARGNHPESRERSVREGRPYPTRYLREAPLPNEQRVSNVEATSEAFCIPYEDAWAERRAHADAPYGIEILSDRIILAIFYREYAFRT